MPDIVSSNASEKAIQGYVSGSIESNVKPYLIKGVTNSSGVVTLWVTDNNLSTGNAVFSQIFTDGIVAMPVGSLSNYQVTAITVSSDIKSVTVTVNQLGSVILGLVNVTTAASGVEVRAVIMGK